MNIGAKTSIAITVVLAASAAGYLSANRRAPGVETSVQAGNTDAQATSIGRLKARVAQLERQGRPTAELEVLAAEIMTLEKRLDILQASKGTAGEPTRIHPAVPSVTERVSSVGELLREEHRRQAVDSAGTRQLGTAASQSIEGTRELSELSLEKITCTSASCIMEVQLPPGRSFTDLQPYFVLGLAELIGDVAFNTDKETNRVTLYIARRGHQLPGLQN